MPEELPRELGALIDTRPPEAKLKDFNQLEFVAAAAPVEWKEKKNWRTFPMQNQDGSGSCVAQTIKKLAGIQIFNKEGVYVEFSATPIYQMRSNRPSTGMIGVEAFDLWKNNGLTLEALVSSTKMSDEQMDTAKIEQYEKDIGAVFKMGGHVGIPNGDFERVASTIQQTGKGVMVWFYFTSPEWSKKMPTVDGTIELRADSTIRHSVAAVDFGLINGKKYLKIEDSAHFGKLYERWISEEFFKKRNFFSRYAMNFTFQDQTNPIPEPSPVPVNPKPKHTFTKALEFIPLDANGAISDPAKNDFQKNDVVALQNILKYEGFFPLNVDSTGYYGATTAKGVYNWQVRHAIAPLSELDSIKPKGGRVGSKTITRLNQLYGNA